VCKSGITKDTLIPIFTKENNQDPRKKEEKEAENIPNRPGARRTQPQPNQNFSQNRFGMGTWGMGPGT
jgi:hypothetical protein